LKYKQILKTSMTERKIKIKSDSYHGNVIKKSFRLPRLCFLHDRCLIMLEQSRDTWWIGVHIYGGMMIAKSMCSNIIYLYLCTVMLHVI